MDIASLEKCEFINPLSYITRNVHVSCAETTFLPQGKVANLKITRHNCEFRLNLNLCLGIGSGNCTVMSLEILAAMKEVTSHTKNAS